MKKEDFLRQKGMKIRKVTPSDIKVAKNAMRTTLLKQNQERNILVQVGH